MAEEAKNAVPEEVKPEKKKSSSSKKHVRRKVTAMTRDEVEKALENVRQHMGGTHSAHAQALLARLAVLNQTPKPEPMRKAA